MRYLCGVPDRIADAGRQQAKASTAGAGTDETEAVVSLPSSNQKQRKVLLQCALDTVDLAHTLSLARAVAPYVDALEIGTPCIKCHGLGVVRELRSRYPLHLIVVDLKTMDAGYYEVEPFLQYGADVVTVLGVADDRTISGVEATRIYGRRAQVDLINVADKPARARQVAALGADIVGVHTGLDQQDGGTPLADLAAVAELGLFGTISVAGGIGAETARRAVDAGASIVVAGAAICAVPDPAGAAAQICGILHEARLGRPAEEAVSGREIC